MGTDQPEISYDFDERPRAGMLSASIFAGRSAMRQELCGDAEASGFSIRECAPLQALLGDGPDFLGDVVLVDCPALTPVGMAALAALDDRAARQAKQLIISTGMEALEGVFSACDRSEPQILVDPSRADRVMALGRVLAESGGAAVRELSEADRLMLLRLTEQVGQIAERLDTFGGAEQAAADSAAASAKEGEGETKPARAARPPLPEPRLVRLIIQHRQARRKFFDADLFADPAWDILLDLTAARAEYARVAVTSLCIAAGVPPTTALRWIGQMTKAGLLERVEDEADKRRAFIALTDEAADAMARYFAMLGKDAALVA